MIKDIQGFCPHCRYREFGNYCGRCGSRLIDIARFDMKCECGKDILPWNYYCRDCGKGTTMDNIISYLEKQEEK